MPVPEKWCDVEYPKLQLQFQLLLLTLTLACGAMAGVEFVGLIVAVTIWCWVKGNCSSSKKGATVVENDEMYGAPQKDAFITRILMNR